MVPGLLWEETIRNNHVLIYEKKGSDIETLFKKASNKFSPITIGMIFHLSICALENVHNKKIIHGNLKPSKILTNDSEDGHKLFISGFEFCERKSSRSANKITKNVDPKAKKLNENAYSSVNVHKDQPLGYRDDLESLGYIIFNLFSEGKFFENHQVFSESKREALIKMKSSIRTNPLMKEIPAEFGEYIRYMNKLKPDDAPNYDQLKVLTFKLCQKIYVKQEIINIFDWVNIAEEDKNNYRARMLSYFFCNESSNTLGVKKLKVQKFSYDNIFLKRKNSNPTLKTNSLPQALPTDPQGQVTKTFQNMPILETQEEQNATTDKYYLDGFQMELDEEYASFPTTPRLTTKEKVYISYTSKMGKLRSPHTEDKVESTSDKIDAKKEVENNLPQANEEMKKEDVVTDTIDDDQINEDAHMPINTNHNIENYSMKVRKSLIAKTPVNIGSIDIPPVKEASLKELPSKESPPKETVIKEIPLKEVKSNVASQSAVSADSKRSYRESYGSLPKAKLKFEQIRPADK